MQKIPGIGDIPILGLLFRSKAAQKDQTELVVMITPQILPRNSRGVTGELPRLPEPLLAPLPLKQTIEPPPPAFRPGGSGSTSAAEGARVLSALTPAGPRPLVVVPRQRRPRPRCSPRRTRPAPRRRTRRAR